MFNPSDPVQAGLELVVLALAGAALVALTFLIVAAFRARRALQL